MRRVQVVTWVWVAAFSTLLIAAPNAGAGYVNVISSFTGGIVEGPSYRYGLGIEYDGQYLWTSHAELMCKRVYPTGSIVSSFGLPLFAHDLAYDGRYFYTDHYGPYYHIYVLDPSSGSIISSWPYPDSPCCWGLTWDGRDLYSVTRWQSRILHLTTGGSVISTFAIPCSRPADVAYDGISPGGPFIWCCDEPPEERGGTSYIYQLTTTGSLIESAPWPVSGSDIWGLAFDGTDLWCMESSKCRYNKAYRVRFVSDIAVVPASVGRIKALYR